MPIFDFSEEEAEKEMAKMQNALAYSELLGVGLSEAYHNQEDILRVSKEKGYSLPEFDKSNWKTAGEYAAYIPYLAVKLVYGALKPFIAPLEGTPFDSNEAMRTASAYWREKIGEGLTIPDVTLDLNEQGKLGLRKVETPVADIMGLTAEITGAVGVPIRLAHTSAVLLTEKCVRAARPFYRSIINGMITGALIGEGKKEETLYNMALFGVFEPLAYSAGKLSGVPAKIRESRHWRRKQASVKERGLLLKNLDDMIRDNPNISEGEILKKWDNPMWREQAFKRYVSPKEEFKIPEEAPRVRPPVVEEVRVPPPARVEGVELKPFKKEVYNAIKGKERMFLKPAEGTYRTIVDRGEEIGIVGYKGTKEEPFATIGILEEFRGEGYLDRAYETLSEEYGLDRIYVDIERSNIKSVESHKASGFKEVVGRGPDRKLYETDIRMYKDMVEVPVEEVPEVTKFEGFVKSLPDKMKKGKKFEDVEKIFKLVEEKYPQVEDKITRISYVDLPGRHGETQGGVIAISTVDPITLGHEIGELLQPAVSLRREVRGEVITGPEARERDALSDAVAYVLMEEAGVKTPRKKPPPELLDKARTLITGEEPEIPSPRMRDITEEAARGIKKTKTRVRLVTGQTKVSELVREDIALVASLRRAAREARHAMSVGKKEGYEKAKAHYLNLRERAKKRVAQRKYVQKLVDNIAKPTGNIDFFYKEGIENLREGIDPHFRAAKTLGAKERMQRFFKENPDRMAEMPVKFMKELNKKPLNDYTIDDLVKISNEISRLRKLGKTKRKLQLVQERRAFEETKDDIIITATKGKVKKEDLPVVRATRRKPRKIDLARAMTLRPARLFDKLDRGKRFTGPAHKFFYDEVNRGVDESLRMIDTRLAASAAKRKELGLSARDILKTRKVGKVKFAVDEMLDIYAGWKNPRKKLALMYGNNITEEMFTKISDALTTPEKQFAEWIVSEYGRNYSRVRESHIEYANEDMGWEPFYTPIRRMDLTPNKYKSELADEILVRFNLKKAYVAKGFTIERKDIPKEYQKPLSLGLYNTWLDQVPKQERYINLGAKVKDIQKMTSDPDFRQIVIDNFGPEYLRAVENYNNRVANPEIYKAFTQMEKISQTLRKNMVIAYLSYNLVTMGKQLPSVLLYLPETGPAHLIASGLQFAANPIKAIRFANERDPQMKHRMIERELEEMKYSGKIMKKVGRFGMKGIKGFDRVAVTIGWRGVYNKNVGKVGEEEAIRLAQNATLRTQPAAHAKDLPDLYASAEYLNWLLQFTNQLNQIYNIATYDIPQDIRRGRLYRAFLSSIALAMVSLVIYAISYRRIPEDLDDVKEAIKEEAIMAIPLVGRTIMAASKGWESPSPALKGAVAMGKLISGAERATKAKAVLESIFVMMGLPYTGPKRIKKAIEEGPIELLGPEKPKKRGRRRYR